MTVPKTKVLAPKLNKYVHFIHRDFMQRSRIPMAKAHMPFRSVYGVIPSTPLPVDSTGNASVLCPMDDNDQYGICGPAAAAHLLGILSYGQGKRKEWIADPNALLKQYLAISGGDNGTDEDMMVGPNGIYTVGVAGDKTAIAVDSLDIDITNVPLAQYVIDKFYGYQLAWSVPDAFIQGFDTGTVWAQAMTPNPNNGHYTAQADLSGTATVSAIDITGFSRLWTWGTWCWTSPAFLASVQPQAFAVLSPMQFGPDGYDSKGRHVSAIAAIWNSLGGSATKSAALVAMFPAIPTPTPPVPVVPPVVVPPAPTPLTWFQELINLWVSLFGKEKAKGASAGLSGWWSILVGIIEQYATAWWPVIGPEVLTQIQDWINSIPGIPPAVVAAIDAFLAALSTHSLPKLKYDPK